MNTAGWRRPPGWVPAVAYLVLALAWAWPLPLHLANRFAHDAGDPLLVTYLLWWNAHVVPLSERMWSAPFYWPLRDALALTEHGAGMGIVASPIQWLGGSPLLAYNVLLIVSTWWSALAAYALVRRITGSAAGAFAAGLAFGFAPYRASQLAHLHLLVTWWLPLALLALHAYTEDGRWPWLVLFGLSWLLQSLTSGYYMFFLPLLLIAWLLAFTPWRTHPSRAAMVSLAWVTSSLPLIPVLLKYYDVQRRLGLGRTRGEMQLFSAHLSSFINPGPLLRFWTPRESVTQEDFLFPGVVVLLIIGAGFAVAWGGFDRPSRRRFAFYALAALLTAWLAFGPAPEQRSLATLWHAYGWIAWLPGFSGLRVPERFFMLTTLCLSVAAGIAIAAIVAVYPKRAGLIVTIACLGLVADGWLVAMPLGVPPGPFGVDIAADARVLELPTTDENVNIAALYRGILHRQPVINGYAGYVPPHAGVLEWALGRNDASVLTELRRGHPLYVAVANGLDAPRWIAFMDAQPEATMIGVSGAGRLYAMPAAPYARQIGAGTQLVPIQASAREGWLVVDLGRIASIRAVDLRTRGHVLLLGATVRVETSVDGTAWTLAADESPGGLALNGALAQPLVVPLRIAVGDVSARYVRVNAAAFTPAALSIYGS